CLACGPKTWLMVLSRPAQRAQLSTPETAPVHFAPWNIDNGKILTRREMALVLADLKARAERSPNAHFNLILFRLAACCGLRVSEIAQLHIGDVDVGKFRPHLRVRAEAAKGGRARRVPIWWDAGTLADLAAWKAERLAQGAKQADPFLASQRAGAAAH